MPGIKLLIGLQSLNDPKVAKARAEKINLNAAAFGMQPIQAEYVKNEFTNMFQTIGKDLPIETAGYSPGRSEARIKGHVIILPAELGTANFRSKLFHESAHFSEVDNPSVAKKAIDFVKERATGPQEKLSKLTGLPYGDAELAYPDRFIDPYIGKLYTDPKMFDTDTTEVMSVGFECFATPNQVVELYKKDPEHFQVIIDYIKQDRKDLDAEAAESRRKRAAGKSLREK
jgi:hypothetical protein